MLIIKQARCIWRVTPGNILKMAAELAAEAAVEMTAEMGTEAA
jgi:hypothetical protein